MANLFIMVGAPGSGKSTWIKKHLDKFDKYVSRDEIRFSMAAEDEEYFSKENEVFSEYCRQITQNLINGYDTFADATHINSKSREKLLKNVSGYTDIFAIVFEHPVEITLSRNEQRKGTRAYVPRSVIRRMNNQFEFPTHEEGFKVIYRVNPDDTVEIIKERMEEII